MQVKRTLIGQSRSCEPRTSVAVAEVEERESWNKPGFADPAHELEVIEVRIRKPFDAAERIAGSGREYKQRDPVTVHSELLTHARTEQKRDWQKHERGGWNQRERYDERDGERQTAEREESSEGLFEELVLYLRGICDGERLDRGSRLREAVRRSVHANSSEIIPRAWASG